MNKKGFTLIEMLAVIVLLSVLSVFAVVSITKTYKKQKQENYENEISQILSGARNYFSENLGSNSVPVSDLIPKYADVSADTKDRIGNVSVYKRSCNTATTTTIKTKIEIEVPEYLAGARTSVKYNDCGCEEQPEGKEDATKLCTN